MDQNFPRFSSVPWYLNLREMPTSFHLFPHLLTGRPLMPTVGGGANGAGDDHKGDTFTTTTFSPAAYRTLTSSYQHHLKNSFPLCSNPAAAAASAAAAAAAAVAVSSSSAVANVFTRNSPGMCSPTGFKRRHEEDVTIVSERLQASYANGAFSRSAWFRPRSPGQPLVCPLCGISLEGNDITAHFYEEVHKMEFLRKAYDSGTREDQSSNCELKVNTGSESGDSDGFKRTRLLQDKLQPCTRWQTYQRVKHNRHTRLSAGLLRCNKRYMDEKGRGGVESPTSVTTTTSTGLTTTPIEPSKGIWSIAGDIDDQRDCRKSSELSRNRINDLGRDGPTINVDYPPAFTAREDREGSTVSSEYPASFGAPGDREGSTISVENGLSYSEDSDNNGSQSEVGANSPA